MKLRILPLLILLLTPAIHGAQDAPEKVAEAVQASYLVTYSGATIGWSTESVTATNADGNKGWHERSEMFLSIRRSFDQQAFTFTGVTESWYDADWRELRSVSTMVSGGQTSVTEATFGETIKISTSVDKGPPLVTELKPGERPVLSTMQAWLKLKSEGMKPGATLAFSGVDTDTHTLVDEVWTVTGPVKRKLPDGKIGEGIEVKMLKGGRASTAVIGDDDMPLHVTMAGGFALERVAKIPDPFVPDLMEIESIMEMDTLIEDFLDIESMEVVFDYTHDDGNGLPLIADNNGYHNVKKTEKGYALQLKAQRVSKDAAALPFPLEKISDSARPLLAATPMCQADDKVLAAEARRLTKDAKTALEAARAIMAFIEEHLEPESGDTGAASARQAYDEKKGDCTEHAALFVALARAAGLPARNASGIVYISTDEFAIMGYHAWAEVWLGEWVTVDTTVSEIGLSARYILLTYDEPGETHGSGRVERLVEQSIKPRINAYTLKDGKPWRREGTKDPFKE